MRGIWKKIWRHFTSPILRNFLTKLKNIFMEIFAYRLTKPYDDICMFFAHKLIFVNVRGYRLTKEHVKCFIILTSQYTYQSQFKFVDGCARRVFLWVCHPQKYESRW